MVIDKNEDHTSMEVPNDQAKEAPNEDGVVILTDQTLKDNPKPESEADVEILNAVVSRTLDNTPITCPHGKLSFQNISNMKRVSPVCFLLTLIWISALKFLNIFRSHASLLGNIFAKHLAPLIQSYLKSLIVMNAANNFQRVCDIFVHFNTSVH